MSVELLNKFFDQITGELQAKSPLYLRVKVLPKSPKNEIVERMEDSTYKIRIAAPATDNKANIELCRFLKKNLKAGEVVIISGQTDRMKLVRISF